jgi:hypothetical protein
MREEVLMLSNLLQLQWGSEGMSAMDLSPKLSLILACLTSTHHLLKQGTEQC